MEQVAGAGTGVGVAVTIGDSIDDIYTEEAIISHLDGIQVGPAFVDDLLKLRCFRFRLDDVLVTPEEEPRASKLATSILVKLRELNLGPFAQNIFGFPNLVSKDAVLRDKHGIEIPLVDQKGIVEKVGNVCHFDPILPANRLPYV